MPDHQHRAVYRAAIRNLTDVAVDLTELKNVHVGDDRFPLIARQVVEDFFIEMDTLALLRPDAWVTEQHAIGPAREIRTCKETGGQKALVLHPI